ncbi:MAG: hypothetical protein U0U69_05735 [Acidimicrobiia bacterium]
MAFVIVFLVLLLLAALAICGLLLLLLRWDLDVRSQDREQALDRKLSDLRAAQRIQRAAWQAEHDLISAAREHSDNPDS